MTSHITGNLRVGRVSVRTAYHEGRPMSYVVDNVGPGGLVKGTLKLDREEAIDLRDALNRILPSEGDE